jgi:hypothetical protein
MQMVKRDRRGNIQPLPVEAAPAPAPKNPSISSPDPVGHPMLPQTDAMVRLRSQRSIARLAAAAAAQVTNPVARAFKSSSKTAIVPPASPELPDVLQESVLAITESTVTPSTLAPALDADDDMPLVEVARQHSVSKALANLTKRASGKSRSRSNTAIIDSPPMPAPPSPPRVVKTGPPPLAATKPVATSAPLPSATTPGPSALLSPNVAMRPAPVKVNKLGTRRIYIGGSEVYTIVELTDRMMPRDILHEVQRNGDLPKDGQPTTAGWALFELWRDLGVGACSALPF